MFEAEIDMSDKEFRMYFDYQTQDYKNQLSLNDLLIFMDVNIQMQIGILFQRQQIVIRHL